MKQADCIFCKIINKELDSYKVYENEYVYAFLDTFPTSDGHTLIIPKKHFANLMECDDLYVAEVAKAAKIVSLKLQGVLNPRGFNYVSNLGGDAYQVVMHFHLHVLPKHHKDFGYLLKRDTSKNIPIKDIYEKITTYDQQNNK